MFVNKSQISQVFQKIGKKMKEKKASWKQLVMQQHKQTPQYAKKMPGSNSLIDHSEVSLKTLKLILVNQKVGLTNEELDLAINAFDTNYVTLEKIEKQIQQAEQIQNEIQRQTALQVQELVQAMQLAV